MGEELDSVVITIDPYTFTKEYVEVGVSVISLVRRFFHMWTHMLMVSGLIF